MQQSGAEIGARIGSRQRRAFARTPIVAALAVILAFASPVSAQTPTPDSQPPSATVPDVAPVPVPPTGIAPTEVAPPVENETAPASSAPETGLALPRDLSPWGMYRDADIVVRAVIVGLAFASVVTWTIALMKSLEIFSATLRLRSSARRIAGSEGLDEAERSHATTGIALALIGAAKQEAHRSQDLLRADMVGGVKERIALSLARIEANAVRRKQRTVGILATIGSTAPFEEIPEEVIEEPVEEREPIVEPEPVEEPEPIQEPEPIEEVIEPEPVVEEVEPEPVEELPEEIEPMEETDAAIVLPRLPRTRPEPPSPSR